MSPAPAVVSRSGTATVYNPLLAAVTAAVAAEFDRRAASYRNVFDADAPTGLEILAGAGLAWAGSQGGATILGGVPIFAFCVGLAFLIQWFVFVPAYLQQSEKFFDLTGSLTYLSVVAIGIALGSRDPRALLLAVLVGGTGLYLRAVVDDLELPGRFPAVVAELEDEQS